MAKRYAELRGLMAANDYSRAQLGRKLGRQSTYMNLRFAGHRDFTLCEAYTILDLFHVPHSRLHEIFPPDGIRESDRG